MCKIQMIRLHSKSGNSYEYDPRTPPIKVEAYWSCYAGHCVSMTTPMPITIYNIVPDSIERVLNWIKNAPIHALNHPNIILPTDYIIETKDDFTNKTIKHLYFIENTCDSISLSSLMKGQKKGMNGKSTEFVAQMYDLYKHNRICFARNVVIEILKGLEHLHGKGICIGCINPDYIMFTVDNRIAINFMGVYHWCEVKKAFSLQCSTKHSVISLIGAISLEHGTMIAPELEFGINDSRGDLYSIGIMLFSIIAGHLPPQNREIPLSEIKNNQLRKIIKKATEKAPSKRFQSALEFMNTINEMDEIIPWYKKLDSFFSFFRIKNRLACIFISILITSFFCFKTDAQNTMRINYKDGSISEVPIGRIDSITFVEKDEEAHEVSLIGEWFWGSKEKGYYEVLSFNEDRTYIGYDYYLEYGVDGWTYGTYMANGMMLYLWSNGFGYRRTYKWFVTGLTENALEVMTQMGSFIYYRIQPEVYSLKVGEKSYACKDGDYYVFTDGVKVLDDEGKLKGVCEGLTYILKYNAKSGLIMAYKVKVEK